MKKVVIVILFLIIICLTIFSIKSYKSRWATLTIAEKVKKTMEKMTLKEKVGQMLMIYYGSDEYDDVLNTSIDTYQPGGFIIMGNNINEYKDLQNLIISIQDSSSIPMFISIDEEGGTVQRLKNLSDANITNIPAMMEVGKTNDSELAKSIGKIIGKELNVFGINMNFAPVLDINTDGLNNVIGSRSFGTESEVVSKMGIAFSKGLKSENIIPVFKHFPGHGETIEDPHEELPILNKTKEELYNLELKPFINAINENAEVIMVGHFIIPSISSNPCSLSKEIINDLLINELKFNGVVITDALNMKAITDNYSLSEVVKSAINSGVNILLMPGYSSQVVKEILRLVEIGEIPEEKINISVKKILVLKYKYELDKKHINYGINTLNSKNNQKIIEKIHN